MNADSSPFRKTCDACTKSKSKCNGAQPCQACERRSEVCVYAFKRKRGPLKRKGSSQVRADDPLSAKRARLADDEASARGGARPQEAALITPYERRLWTVFFTVFRNQQNAFSDKKEKGIAWCWFARQLELIKQHSQRVGNDHLIIMVNTFLESLDLRMQSVASAIEHKCPFSASACADCASSALSAPAARLHASGGAGHGHGHGHGLGHGHGHEHHVAGGGVLELERVVRIADGQLVTLDSVSPTVIAVDSSTSLHDVPGSAVVLAMRRELDGNELPGFLIDMVERPIARSTVRVNAKFTEAFGLSERDTNALLAWSGNEFLPWGADVLAKLMVSELDVVTYMQVMCLKFQAVGVPKKAAVREVPTAYSAKLWLKGGGDGAQWEQKQCLIEVNHRILAVKHNVESTIICTIRVLGGAYDADETQSAPVVHETETVAKHEAETHAGHVTEAELILDGALGCVEGCSHFALLREELQCERFTSHLGE